MDKKFFFTVMSAVIGAAAPTAVGLAIAPVLPTGAWRLVARIGGPLLTVGSATALAVVVAMRDELRAADNAAANARAEWAEAARAEAAEARAEPKAEPKAVAA